MEVKDARKRRREKRVKERPSYDARERKREKDLDKPLNKKGDTMGYALERVSQDAMYPDVESPTDWTKGPGMMEINVRDYVKAAHSINPPKKKAKKKKAKKNKKGSK